MSLRFQAGVALMIVVVAVVQIWSALRVAETRHTLDRNQQTRQEICSLRRAIEPGTQLERAMRDYYQHHSELC